MVRRPPRQPRSQLRSVRAHSVPAISARPRFVRIVTGHRHRPDRVTTTICRATIVCCRTGVEYCSLSCVVDKNVFLHELSQSRMRRFVGDPP